jgi:tetratricopeptide (TPR) repeat protein
VRTLLTAGFLFLTANGFYLLLFVGPNLLYLANVFLHFGVGLLVTVPFGLWGIRLFRADTAGFPGRGVARHSFVMMAGGIATGIALAVVGALRANRWLVDAHMTVAAVGLVLLAYGTGLPRRGGPGSPGPEQRRARRAALPVSLLLLVGGLWAARAASLPAGPGVENPDSPPLRMEDEAMGGKDGPFFPSSAATSTGESIPSGFFTESERACARCHRDIYAQWFSSAHHFSSFNNQWYAKAIEYMQEVSDVQPSKWCAGCHDVALLFTGLMDRPAREVARTAEGQAGLGCVACHAISRVKSTMGQGDYVIEYPWLHRLAGSESRLLRASHDFLVHLNPELHRRTFLKPFHRSEGANGAEFCSACHKVHLDVPVNNYRWVRGFNEYDAWQASGVSGQGARSFYSPPEPRSCGECHMPLVPSRDKGNRNGFVHSHRFPGANTALPVANNDREQLEAVVGFLKGSVSIDIFAVTREAPGALRSIVAPIDDAGVAVRPGEPVLIDVVVRNRKTGHFFPGGTVDAFDVWVELKATDAAGTVIFWSGPVENEERGAVEAGAHFYRSYLLDAHGNHINKRNAWAARSVLYSRLIPPGAADTVHFRLDVPRDVTGPITLEARVNYRKFMWWNTQFAFRGMRDPAEPRLEVTKDYDDGRWIFDPARSAPHLPIVVVAESRALLRVLNGNLEPPEPARAANPRARERWNDYGIGLLLQGDLRNAERAFAKVTEIDPAYVDGWVNRARVHVEEGNAPAAVPLLEKALALDPTLAKTHYFLGLALKAQGRYEDALRAFRRAAARYPRDRVIRNEIGKMLYLLRRFDESVAELQRVIKIEPEDLPAHYTLMLNYQALDRADLASRERQLYLRFKADESAPTITGGVRRTDPLANNEAQSIHEHRSVRLPWTANQRGRVP